MSKQFKSIRVGPFDVPIVPIKGNDKETPMGEFSRVDKTISLSTTFYNEQREAETLLHELFHALFEIYGMKTKDSEERIVSQMSLGFAQVMRDNPEMMDWLRNSLK